MTVSSIKESEQPFPSVEECFFCSGHLPCREHKPRDFADVDFQEYVMGEIDGKELFERQGVEYSG